MKTLNDVLQYRAGHTPDDTAYIFLNDQGEEKSRLTYREVDERARRIAATLREHLRPGERALLLYPDAEDFIAPFLGCLYAGVIAVPAYPPRPKRLGHLLSIAADAGTTLALTTTAVATRLQKRVTEEFAGLQFRVITTDDIERQKTSTAGFVPFPAGENDLALLQYTSGATGHPKGVMVSHGCLLHNERVLTEAMGLSAQSVGCGWLPVFHDMGLVGNLLNPLFCGYPCVLLSPMAFMKRPLTWLEAVSKYRVTGTGGPNFAYELCLRNIKPDERAKLDLSSWDSAFCGAEPVRPETRKRFAEYFAPSGFRAKAFYPCYGLAEATLLVTGGLKLTPARTLTVDREQLQRGLAQLSTEKADKASTAVLISCGQPWQGTTLRIVDPAIRRGVPERSVGEIWVAGESVAAGYWNNPSATEATFRAFLEDGEGPYLRTGDLGFLDGGELYVTGRIKDVIIIRGRNYYPHDVEDAVEGCHPAIHPSKAIAFSVDKDGEEQLIVAVEVDRQALRDLDVDAVVLAVRRSVIESQELAVAGVLLLNPGGLPRTSSGKVRRGTCRDLFLSKRLDVLAAWRADDTSRQGSLQPPSGPNAIDVVDWIVKWASRELKLGVSAIDLSRPLTDYGMDSRAGAQFVLALEEWLQRPVQPELLWELPSIAALADHLANPSRPQLPSERAFLGRLTPARGTPPLSVGLQVLTGSSAPRAVSERMGFSLFFFASDQGTDRDKYRLVIESARYADNHGFTGIWTPERHFHPFGGLFPNPAVLGAALARETQNLRIRAGSVVMPLNHPVRVAEEWAMVDNLSGGRVDLAFTSGWNPNDFAINPGAYEERRKVTLRDMETVRRMWRGEPYRGPNGTGQMVELPLYPRPVQPELQAWLTCNRSGDGFVDAGAAGANVLTALLLQTPEELAERIRAYRQARADNGHDPKAGHVTLMLHTFLGEDPQAVKDLVRGPLTEYLRTSVDLWRGGSTRLEEMSDAERARLPELAFERYFHTSSLLGSVESCRKMVERLHRIGVDEIACLIDFGLPTDTVLAGLKQIEWLKQVMNSPIEQKPEPSSADPSVAIGRDAARSRARPWILTPVPRPEAQLRLFCLPPAGADARAFEGWGEHFPTNIEVNLIDAPQQQERLADLFAELIPALLPRLDRPFAFYGHSVGGLIAFELARELRQKHGREPVHLFIGAQHPPQRPFPYPSHKDLATPAGLAFIGANFPVGANFATDERQQAQLARIIQALKPGMLIQDDNYVFKAGAPLSCPITVFGGTQDPVIKPKDLQLWQAHTSSEFSLEMLAGGHLFLREQRSELARQIAERTSRAER